MESKVIQVEDLKKHFEDVKAVDGIDFSVAKDEIFGFLGPNGAGKTTTIRMLTGVIKPTHGSIKIFDNDFWENPIPIKQRIGNVPEMANVYVDLTAVENINLIGELYGIPKEQINERTQFLLKQFDLYGRRDDKAKKFSKGMKQRLLLCMALISEPEILFLDEPTSGLDVQSSFIIKKLIKEYNEKGTTIFLTTHNMHVANELCDRIAIMNKGKLISLNTPEKLKNIVKKNLVIEFSLDKKVAKEELMAFNSIQKLSELKDKWHASVLDINDALKELLEYAEAEGLVIENLNTPEPHLEDVFLKLINESDSKNE